MMRFLTIFKKIEKHCANDASNDVHRPPLAQDPAGRTRSPLVLHICVVPLSSAQGRHFPVVLSWIDFQD